MKKLMIIGAGGHAKVCIELAEKTNEYSKIDLLDDNLVGANVLNKDVIGKTDEFYKFKETHSFIVAIGSNTIRNEIFNRLIENEVAIATLISKDALISSSSKIGKGSMILAGVIINSSTIIGDNVIVNTGAIVEHDCVIEDSCHISPGAILCGGVSVGKLSWVGAGSVLNPLVQVKRNTTIGSNSTVIDSLDVAGVYVGSPVRRVS